MNCQEFWDHLPQRGHDITEAQAGHLAECAPCAAQWAASGAGGRACTPWAKSGANGSSAAWKRG
jgi:hypothetical protein